MAGTVRKPRMKEVPLSEIKDDLSRFHREAETQEIDTARHGKPAGVLIRFKSEEDGSKATRDFSVASNGLARACTQRVGSNSSILRRSSCADLPPREAARIRRQ
jgi:hypothetical protein